MSATATNKQPLLMDRPFHRIVEMGGTSSSTTDVDPGIGTNAALLLDCTSGEGALIEDLYLLQRVVDNVTIINFYLAPSASVLTEGVFAGRLVFPATQPVGTILSMQLRRLLAPVAHAVHSGATEQPQLRGWRIERGWALWGASATASAAPNAPSVGLQGGFY